jgi:hypothetical protein
VHYRVRSQGLSPLVSWLEFYAEFWTQRLDKLEQLLSEMDQK